MPSDTRSEAGSDDGRNDPITLAAELLARCGLPDAGATLVREHAPDRSGRCRGCPHSSTPAPIHPCRLRLVGDKLERIGAVEKATGGEIEQHDGSAPAPMGAGADPGRNQRA